MKSTGRAAVKSVFWSRLLGLLIAFAIVAVLVFGGVKDLMSELSAAYQALGESQSELALTQRQLDGVQDDLAETQGNLATLEKIAASQQSALDMSRRQIAYKHQLIQDLASEKWELKRALREAAVTVAEQSRQLRATQNALRATKAELDHHLSQPKLSMVVTTERMMQTSYRESFAASQVKLFAEGDNGMVYFEGSAMRHEVEKHAQYAERTQIVITETAPGQDALRCLSDASLGCSRVIAAQVSQKQMAYAYQSQFSAAGMRMLVAR